MNDDDCIRLLRAVLPPLGMRWAGFRKPRRQVCRRIARRMGEVGVRSVEGYLDFLEQHPEEWRMLDRLCRVTISRFRRDRGLWRRLEKAVLPELAERLGPTRGEAGGGTLSCWSAGCASGEEPYTLSILWSLCLAPRFPGVSLRVLATDSDLHLLHRARRAVFPAGAMKEIPESWIEAAFEPAPEGELRFRRSFRAAVRLVRADVRDEISRARFDLILCRNLAFTYYREDLQRRIAVRLGRRTRPGGYLAVGAHEALPRGAGAWQDVGEGLYRRVDDRRGGRAPKMDSGAGGSSGGEPDSEDSRA